MCVNIHVCVVLCPLKAGMYVQSSDHKQQTSALQNGITNHSHMIASVIGKSQASLIT